MLMFRLVSKNIRILLSSCYDSRKESWKQISSLIDLAKREDIMWHKIIIPSRFWSESIPRKIQVASKANGVINKKYSK